MPTPTDLVTDLPADFEVFGQAVDSSLADLKGGTSGQVLSKNSNTDMDFVWVTSDDANAIQNTIVDAKGDLIAASASDVPARLAVGANGETLVADSSTSTGLRYQSAYNGNAIINGGMDIWQRGTSIASSGSGYVYTADRWRFVRGNFATGGTVSRQNTSDTTNLPTIQYCARVQRDSGNTSTDYLEVFNALENSDSTRFIGQTVTLSFYARAGANFSSASSALTPKIISGTGTNQPAPDFTGLANVSAVTATLTTTWQRFTRTGTVSASATQVGVTFGFTPVGTAGANDWFEVTGVQLELGSVATTFKRAGGTIQGELAACQRYYQRTTVQDSAGRMSGSTPANSTTGVFCIVQHPVQFRTAPTAIDYSLLGIADGVNAIITPSSYAINNAGINYSVIAIGATGLTQYRNYFLIANSSTSAYLGFSAEL